MASGQELKVLQDNEEEILSVLKNSDLELVCKELLRFGIITQRVKEDFLSLDLDRLDHELCAYFLLHHLYDKLLGDIGIFSLFVKMLRGLGGSLKALGEWLELCEVGFEREEESETEPTEVAVVGLKRSRRQGLTLCEGDVNILVQLLHSVTHCWEEIAIVLDLSKSEIEDCRRPNNNMISLYNVLLKWVSKGSIIRSAQSIISLQKALRSKTVNQGKSAQDLEEKFVKAKADRWQRKSKRQCVIQELRIVQPKDTIAAYGKSALLHVRNVSNSESINFQWMKDGENLSDNQTFSGVNSSLLLVRFMESKLEGSYSCQVWDDKDTVRSDDVSLILFHLSITEKFWEVYRRQDELPEDSWPPVSATSFINLALIMKGKNVSDKFDYAVRGDMDDIIKAKETIEYEEVFGSYKSRWVVLVEGRPGSGKTTLMHKVSRDWSLKRGILQGASIVILIPLRLLDSINADIDLYQIIKLHIEDETIVNEVKSFIEKSNGHKVCFIVDGLDEYSLREDKSTIIYKLINRKFLDASMVIVASRPSGTKNLRKKSFVSERIEVLGFSNENVFEYIKHYPFSHDDTASKLPMYLRSHTNVMHICYLPVHMAMICFLYDQMGDDIPHTETKIYEHFTLLSIVRKLKKKESDEDVPFRALKELTGDTKVFFDNICKLAFDMTISAKQVVHHKDLNIQLTCGQISDDNCFGLVIIDSSARVFNIENFYTFLHLTFQEYLTAVYIAQLERDKQLETIQSYKERVNFLMVWRFFFGCLEFEINAEIFKEIIFSDGMDTLHKVQCAFESQQSAVCQLVLRTGSLLFSENLFTLSDFYAIGHVVLLSGTPLTKLVFDDCSINQDGIQLLGNILQDEHFRDIKYLGYHRKDCKISQFQTLNALLRRTSSLETLDLERTELKIKGVKEMAQNVDFESLKCLKVHMPLLRKDILFFLRSVFAQTVEQIEFDCSHDTSSDTYCEYYELLCIDFKKAVRFDPAYSKNNCHFLGGLHLKLNSNCYDLTLINCGLNDEDAENIAQAVVTYKNMHTIRLDFNKISGKGASCLASCLQKCPFIQVFSAHCNQIDDSGALNLVCAFTSLKSPRCLDLQCNPISGEGVKVITGVMNNLTIEQPCMVHITSVDSDGTNLNLDWQRVKESLYVVSYGDTSKSDLLKFCKYWPQLHINHENDFSLKLNQLDLEIFEELICCKNLLSLRMSREDIFSHLRPCSLNNLSENVISKGFSSWTHLQLLDMTGIDHKFWNLTLLSYCSNLQILYCRKCEIYAVDAAALCKGLSQCRNLKILDVSKNKIGLHGTPHHDNKLADISTNILEYELDNAFSQWNYLVELSLSKNHFDSDNFVFFARAISLCSSLLRLDLSYNDIGLNGAKALSETLSQCSSLQTLNLSGTKISCAGSAYAMVISQCRNLLKINLSHNCIGLNDIQSITTALIKCSNLHELNISCNEIGSDGATALIEGISQCKQLQCLHLHEIGLDGDIHSIVTALTKCSNLQKLELTGNDIGFYCIAHLQNSLPQLSRFSIS